MKSTPGSARATPLAGEVKLVPSMRNVFSLTPEPKADTRELPPVPGDVTEMPGAGPIRSNMLERRVGIVAMSPGPKRVPNPLPRASMREPAPSTTTDSATPATFRTAVRSMVAPAPMPTSVSWYVANPGISMSIVYTPGGSDGNRNCPFSLVIAEAGPQIGGAGATRPGAPGGPPPCAPRPVRMTPPSTPARQPPGEPRRMLRQKTGAGPAAIECPVDVAV